MKTNILILVLIFFASCSLDKKKNDQLTVHPDSLKAIANVMVESEPPNIVFQRLLDSANKFKQGDSIPSFLYNHRLDYEFPWLTDHGQYSIRKLIIDSTSNIGLLRCVLKSEDVRIRRIVDTSEVSNIILLGAIPYNKMSNYDLVLNRMRRFQ